MIPRHAAGVFWGQEAGPAVASVENESGDNARISRGRTAGSRVAINHQFISKFGNGLESFDCATWHRALLDPRRQGHLR